MWKGVDRSHVTLDGTGSGLCPVMGFGVGGAERSVRTVLSVSWLNGATEHVVVVTWEGESTGSIETVAGGGGAGRGELRPCCVQPQAEPVNSRF